MNKAKGNESNVPVHTGWTAEGGVQMSGNWDDIGFIISSRYRILSLRRLAVGPATPSQIAADEDVGIAHVSRALQDLRDKELVDLLVSDNRKKGRVYGLTERGQELWETIDAENLATE
jgi:DNA-binding transcriptional ArsR family regulator